jgi:hypothetical protein
MSERKTTDVGFKVCAGLFCQLMPHRAKLLLPPLLAPIDPSESIDDLCIDFNAFKPWRYTGLTTIFTYFGPFA